RAFVVAREGVPGPVFLECPVDLLYPEALVRSWYSAKTEGKAKSVAEAAVRFYVKRHLKRLFAGGERVRAAEPPAVPPPPPDPKHVRDVAARLGASERPVLVLGSQATLSAAEVKDLATAVGALGVPVYLSGMARGLLGPEHPLQMRHRRKEALREADLVILAGAPNDFRLDYGGHVSRQAVL